MVTRQQLVDALPDHRREAVVAWLASSTGDCVKCGKPVTYSQPRRTTKDGREHVSCPG